MTDEQPKPGEMHLLVDTPGGPHVRVVSPAAPLPASDSPGRSAEAATLSAAQSWGLPDFAFQPVLAAKASGRREVGDGLIIVGRLGMVMQVKHRLSPTDREGRERSWMEKKAAEGTRQVNGTVRTLTTSAVRLTNGRGREVEVLPGVEWVGVVILDHPNPPEGILIEPSGSVPTLVLLRRDWEFLFEQLRSTHAVVHYVARAISDGVVEIGREPVRYYELADADEAAPPDPAAEAIVGNGTVVTVPTLPKAPVGHDDHAGHLVIRALMEDIATSDGDFDEQARLEVLAEIDQLPVVSRAELGRHLMNLVEAVSEAPEEAYAWQFKLLRFPPPSPQLLFGACSRFTELSREGFRRWVMLRHHEFSEMIDDREIRSVGVLLTPRNDGLRPWDTTMFSARGDLGLTQDELEQLRELWNTPRPSPYAVESGPGLGPSAFRR